ncbi:MAG: S49 family peptidase [Pseudomonadota bacterium]
MKKKRPTIAVLDVAGAIDEAKAMALLITIRNTDWRKKNIIGLIVRVGSNGGSLGAAQAICEGIETVRSEVEIVTVALATETAMSAGFYVALACDIVVATPAATVGSVGAIIPKFSGFPLADKLGISFNPAQSGIGKGSLHPLSAPNAASDALLDLLVADIGEQFFDWVRLRRKASDATMALIGDGRMLSGRQAECLGLVDVCGGFYTAIAKVCEQASQEQAALIWLNPPSVSMMGKIVKSIKAFF